MQQVPDQRIPTGITSLDPVLEGGVPRGSVILLIGDIGAGSNEFVYSSMLALSVEKRNKKSSRGLLPEEICYITFTKMKEDIRNEVLGSFHEDMVQGLDLITFEDLSQLYFDASVVPNEWYSKTDIVARLQKRSESENILARLATRLNQVSPNSLIILDSLTDIAGQYYQTHRWNELAAFLRGLQRISKQWNSTIYLLLTRGILDERSELDVADVADAVVLFRWEETTGARRQRVMYFEKFRGLMPHLEDKDLVKFAVRITSASGFEVSNIRVVI